MAQKMIIDDEIYEDRPMTGREIRNIELQVKEKRKRQKKKANARRKRKNGLRR